MWEKLKQGWNDLGHDESIHWTERAKSYSRLGFRKSAGLFMGELADRLFAPVDFLIDTVPAAILRATFKAVKWTGRGAFGLAGGALALAGGTTRAAAYRAPGAIAMASTIGASLFGTAAAIGIGTERVARTVLAGGEWFPYWGEKNVHAIRRFAPSSAIAKRLIGGGLVLGVPGGAISELLSPGVPEPTVFFDGRSMKHVNDMGADGDYAMRLLGRR